VFFSEHSVDATATFARHRIKKDFLGSDFEPP